jgi:small subunit ribosomal protein S8
MRLDPLADALSNIKNCEMVGKREVVIYPASKLLKGVLKILKEHGYIEDYKYYENHRGGVFKVILRGRIHDIKAIKPRFPVKHKEIEQWEQKFLPSWTMGLLIISTPRGIMTNEEAKKEGIGGRLIAYVY